MKLFSNHKQDHVKNILVLGNEHCGRRSFLFYYKDATSISSLALPEIETLSHRVNFSNAKDAITLNFVLNKNRDKLIPSAPAKKERFDAILILVDLSASTASEDLRLLTEFANIHYKEVDTIVVGTKADIRCKESDVIDLISTSAKTGEGFEQLKDQLNLHMNLISRNTLNP